jgi:uncharacterized lipoprotein YajG
MMLNERYDDMRRVFFLLIVFGLASCSRAPGSLGITGPGAPPAPAPAPGDATINVDPSDQGNAYVPSMTPNQGGNTRFYGYD